MLALSGRSIAISSRRHQAGVGMRQQSLGERDLAGAARRIRSCCATPRRASVSRYSLNATSGLSPRHISASLHPSSRAAPRPFGDLVGRHRPRAGIARVLAKCAVGASVAAEIGDRQKNLARVGDVAALAAIAQLGRRGKQGVEVGRRGTRSARSRRPRSSAHRRALGRGYRESERARAARKRVMNASTASIAFIGDQLR